MRHLTISEFGNFLGISGAKLVVKDKEGKIWQTPLSRLRTIRVEKKELAYPLTLSTNAQFVVLGCSLLIGPDDQ